MSDPTDRLSSALEDRYRIERELGEGGMATVYLAEDLKHKRQVAIKVLKPELAAVVGAERFLGEIETTANLQHPHILPLFDSGEADGFLFYVMPYVEGETLRDRLDRERQLGVEDALRITRDVADALDYAHRQGVIHRDIKPENILLHDGRPVVADFGIAVAISAAGGGRMTETGLSLGTPHYMSPEQATADRDLTVRSDVYSLSCVLYEMLAGDPPHTGPSAQAILVRILTEAPRPVDATRASVPPHVAAVLAKGLEKLPADRFDSAAEFRAALDRTDFTYTAIARGTGVAGAVAGNAGARPGIVPRGSRRPGPLVLGLAAVTVILAALALFGWLRPSGVTGDVRTFTLDAPDWDLLPAARIEISSDARYFATLAEPKDSTEQRMHLIVRAADESRFRSLVGPAENLASPRFSPDGTRLVFADREDGAIRVVPVGGGQPSTLYQRSGLVAGELAWGTDGFIYFYAQNPSRILRIPDTGTGEDAEVLIDNAHWAFNPTPLPGGRALLVTDGRRGMPKLRVLEFGADSTRVLLREASAAVWVDDGYLVYAHPDGGLQAVPFDLDALEVTGVSRPVRDGVSVDGEYAFFSIARDGTLVYSEGRTGGWAGDQILVERDLRTGAESRLPLEPRTFSDVRYSPDGRQIAYSAQDSDSDDLRMIYTYDLSLGLTPTPWTTVGENFAPSWSPAGDRLVFEQWRDDEARLMVKSVRSEADPTPLPSVDEDGVTRGNPTWASETLIVFERWTDDTADLWVVPTAEAASSSGTGPTELVASEWELTTPAVSPRGDRIAYLVEGQYDDGEIVVRPFPGPGQPVRVSVGGGFDPRWARDGRSIIYATGLGGGGYSLRRAFVSTEPVFHVDSTRVVIDEIRRGTSWDLHPDGDRIIQSRSEGLGVGDEAQASGSEERHIVVMNWFEELRERLGR